METYDSARSATHRCSPAFSPFTLLIPALVIFIAAGCAAPGEPIERKPPIAEAVKDLSPAQSGNDVILTFTLPTEALDHRQLNQTPTVEIYRDFQPTVSSASAGAPPAANASASAAHTTPSLFVTLLPPVVEQYATNGSVHYPDSISAEDFAQHPDTTVEYMVRTRGRGKSSPDSNLVKLRVYPAPLPIDDVKAVFTRSAVELSWTPPQKTPIGASPPIATYRIYRAEIDSAPESGAVGATSAASLKLKSQLARIGDSNSPAFSDAQAALAIPYVYSVRSVLQYSGASVESADSNFAIITPRDLFPPAAPHGLLAVPAPSQGGAPADVELSWAISPEPDVAGYNIYRSDSQGTRGSRLNQDLLPTPAFRDISIAPGQQYFYSVTAVDRSGNESPASDVVSSEVLAQGPGQN